MKVLDLYCGAGGAGVGYHRAGFEVIGVDIAPQPNYPFELIKADALDLIAPGDVDLIHASPPCQHFTPYNRVHDDLKERYLDLLAPTRDLLERLEVPWVIENVPGAPMRVDLELCGSMFGLDEIRRHRWFEVSWGDLILAPAHNHLPPRRFHSHRGGSLKQRARTTRVMEIGKWAIPLEEQKAAMGIDWKLSLRELSEAIPPAYTQYIAEEFLRRTP